MQKLNIPVGQPSGTSWPRLLLGHACSQGLFFRWASVARARGRSAGALRSLARTRDTSPWDARAAMPARRARGSSACSRSKSWRSMPTTRPVGSKGTHAQAAISQQASSRARRGRPSSCTATTADASASMTGFSFTWSAKWSTACRHDTSSAGGERARGEAARHVAEGGRHELLLLPIAGAREAEGDQAGRRRADDERQGHEPVLQLALEGVRGRSVDDARARGAVQAHDDAVRRAQVLQRVHGDGAELRRAEHTVGDGLQQASFNHHHHV
mmetsp:Transcript_5642/g.16782  ORF Transcript_5642/g.16782 Transcript_5642/m.16782 type:complete len:271 (+) Transcript_5642:50-862(+)